MAIIPGSENEYGNDDSTDFIRSFETREEAEEFARIHKIIDARIIDYDIDGDLTGSALYGIVPHADNVNHPAHYMSYTGLETIDVIEAFTADLQGIEAVCTANVIKYICRWYHKNGIEDLKKAQWYLNKLIEKENDDERYC